MSGWQITPTTRGGMTVWNWSAYGPRGSIVGTATSKLQAERQARDAERTMTQPVRISDTDRTVI